MDCKTQLQRSEADGNEIYSGKVDVSDESEYK